jgi:hypothetical protein
MTPLDREIRKLADQARVHGRRLAWHEIPIWEDGVRAGMKLQRERSAVLIQDLQDRFCEDHGYAKEIRNQAIPGEERE